jgi:hypothetical protein
LNPLLGPQSPTQGSYQSTTDSINTNPINGNNLIATTNTLYGIVTDNRAIMFAARYTWDRFRLFAGYEYIRQMNPANPLGVGASDQGGYILSGVEDNNLDSPKHVQIWWTGGNTPSQKNRHHRGLVSSAAERLPCSDGLLARKFPRFLRGQPQRGVALSGSSLHPAFRRFCRNCGFLRERRSGHRHSSWPRRPLSLRHQPCSDIGGRFTF